MTCSTGAAPAKSALAFNRSGSSPNVIGALNRPTSALCVAALDEDGLDCGAIRTASIIGETRGAASIIGEGRGAASILNSGAGTSSCAPVAVVAVAAVLGGGALTAGATASDRTIQNLVSTIGTRTVAAVDDDDDDVCEKVNGCQYPVAEGRGQSSGMQVRCWSPAGTKLCCAAVISASTTLHPSSSGFPAGSACNTAKL